jgi:hypothetical protein
LLRRVRPEQIVEDQNSGARRASSAAFKDPELSADAEPILQANGLDWRFSLQGYDGYSVVQFKAGHARAKMLPVIHKPIPPSDGIPGNPAHTEVHGKKTQGIANHLVAGSTWVHLEPKRM